MKIKDVKQNTKNKLLPYKLEIQEEVGVHKIKEFIEISHFRKLIRITKYLISLGTISAVMTIISFFSPSDDSIAIDNYQKGIIYLEDDDYKQAEQCFQKVYDINDDFLDIKFYFAYTEYLLDHYDKSYKILDENRNMLNENEIAFYAMYEYSKGNYEKSRKYLNKIKQPENMELISFEHYIITSTELGFQCGYSEGVSSFYANIILLDAKINEAQQLPDVERAFHVEDDDKGQEEVELANEVVERINNNSLVDVLLLKRCKLIAYMQFIAYSIQYDKNTFPIYIFESASELVDFLTNYFVSNKYIEALILFSNGMVFEPRPEEIEKAYKIVVEKYNEIKLLEKQENKKIFKEEDRGNLEACESILEDLENNCLDLKKDKYKFNFSSFGVTDENYNMEDICKSWAENFIESLYIRDDLIEIE